MINKTQTWILILTQPFINGVTLSKLPPSLATLSSFESKGNIAYPLGHYCEC